MAALKTQKTKQSAAAFVAAIKDEGKRKDSKALLKIFKRATGANPVMWGTAIVGYGIYHYKSERSRQEGDWPMAGFSPRVQNMTVYTMLGYQNPKYQALLKKIGKHTSTGSCLYFKRLSDLNPKVLEALIRMGFNDMKKKYPSKRA